MGVARPWSLRTSATHVTAIRSPTAPTPESRASDVVGAVRAKQCRPRSAGSRRRGRSAFRLSGPAEATAEKRSGPLPERALGPVARRTICAPIAHFGRGGRPQGPPLPRTPAGHAARTSLISLPIESLASPNSIDVLGLWNSSFSTPAKPGCMLRLRTMMLAASSTLRIGMP
jgi:hypothetical protein